MAVTSAGVLTWPPTEAQGPSTNVITVSVSDGVASVSRSFTVRATSNENNTCTETVMPNCLKNWPAMLPMKLTGMNTATMVKVVAITARPISSAAANR